MLKKLRIDGAGLSDAQIDAIEELIGQLQTP